MATLGAENTKNRFCSYNDFKKIRDEDLTGNFIEYYYNGHSRVVSMRDLPVNNNPQPPEDRITKEFSAHARRRYYRYMMSLNCDENYITMFMLLTFAREIKLEYNLNLQNYRILVKRFMQSLSRIGFDIISKTEFHADFYPHLHLVLIMYKGFNKLYPEGFISEENCIDISFIRLYLSRLWVEHVYLYVFDLGFSICHCKFFKACCSLRVIKDFGKVVHYLANYVSKKDKEYQNIIPLRWQGLRFTNKSHRNYPQLLQGYERIPITDYAFAKLQKIACSAIELKLKNSRFKKSDDNIIVYRKNGFYVDNILEEYGRILEEKKDDTVCWVK